MGLANTLYQHTALQEFQMFEQQMLSFPELAHLVPRFVPAFTPSAVPAHLLPISPVSDCSFTFASFVVMDSSDWLI